MGRRRKKKFTDPFSGILLVDKPRGITSHDVVHRIRRQFRFDKVGHGGTLDPNATGLLPILLGRGTKLSQRIMGADKVYEGVMILGIRTDSHDRDGEVLAEESFEGVTRERIEREFAARLGDTMQTPPMVSAIKKDGVPLYKLARKGQSVEREPRLVHVYALELLDFRPPEVAFRLKCSKGTYVRTFCHDIGEALGCGAHLGDLARLQTGAFRLEDARPLDELLEMSVEELERASIPLHLVPHMPG